jgi:dienelactone hydrolase
MSAATLAYFRPRLEDFLSRDPGGGGDIVCPPEGCQCPPEGCPPPAPPPPSQPVSLESVQFPLTHARYGAPVERSADRHPVVIYSPGFGYDREYGTMLAEDLASHGYIVVTISHTYEAGEVEFPSQRFELARSEEPSARDSYLAVMLRTADVRFVVDKLGDLAAGRNPDVEQRVLPAGLRASLDMTRIGIYGHSLGGATAAQVMANDDRIWAGVNLDGSFLPGKSTSSPEETEAALIELANRIRGPFMILADGNEGGGGIRGPDGFGTHTSIVYYHLSAWRRFIQIAGTTHGSFTDDEWVISQLADAGIVPWTAPPGERSAATWIGMLNPDRAIAIQRAYIRSFFGLWLKNSDDHLLWGPSPQYPEAAFY